MFFEIIIYMKKLLASDWLKKSTFSCIVTQVQIKNSALVLSKFRLS